MSNVERHMAVLRAGGLVPRKAKLPKDTRVDVVGARAYTHPALAGRTVVRLTPEALIKGDDVEMEVLGFNQPKARGAVGKQKHRAPGFPGWALINDPDHASYALQVMDEFKKEARRARSKPGHAKTGIDAIADKLGRSVPHFLPSFYEEAGRAFLAAGSSNYAAQCFGKAREAENVHALEIDEEVRAEAFLEFALAGAVSIKALGGYAKELAKSYEPEPAYRRFAKLCVQRTLGGLPPWGGMARELRRLAKAAKLDQVAEEHAILSEIIDSPALGKAAGEFWKAYRKPLLTLAKASAKARGALLNLFPAPTTHKPEFDGEWLDFLEEAGALEGLWDPDAPEDARPAGGPAAWFSKLAGHVRRGWRNSYAPTQAFAILRKLGPVLAEGAEPVTLAARWGRTDLDLADLALELGVTLEVDSNSNIRLSEWAELANRDERGRDPAHALAHPQLSKLIDENLDDVMGEEPFESVSQGKPAITAAKKAWLEKRIAEAADGALPSLSSNLDRLESATTAQTFVEIPDAHPKLAAIDCTKPLGRALRGGLLDEIGWTALDEALESLSGDEIGIMGAFPYAIAHNPINAIVVGPEGKVLEHDLQVPKGADLVSMRYVQGQLLVIYRDDSYDWYGYWSDSPKETFELQSAWNLQGLGGRAVTLEDGSVCEGGRALSAGDTTVPVTELLHGDGTTIWVRHWNNSWKLKELDPRTGKMGRSSRPAFLEQYAEGEWKVDESASWILPLPEGLEAPLLGSKDGLAGWRVRYKENKESGSARRRVEVESIDGRKHTGMIGDNDTPTGLLALPGDDRLRPLVQGSGWRGLGSAVIYDPDGEHHLADTSESEYFPGTRALLAPEWWPLYAHRDPKGSAALRKVTDKLAKELLDTAAEEIEAYEGDDQPGMAATAALVGKKLQAITDPRLTKGVIGIVEHAARLQIRQRKLADARDPEGAAALQSDMNHVTDGAVHAALRPIFGYASLWQEGSPSRQLMAASAFFTRDERKNNERFDSVPYSGVDWTALVSSPRAALFLAASMGSTEEGREAVIGLLECWKQSVFAETGQSIRRLEVTLDKEHDFKEDDDDEAPWMLTVDGNDYLIRPVSTHWNNNNFSVVEYAPKGKFKLLDGIHILDEVTLDHPLTAEEIDSFVEALESNGPLQWDPQIAEVLCERTGLTTAEAGLLWAGLPRIDEYETNYLPKEVRTALKLKVAEADAARDSFKPIENRKRARVFAAAVPPDPSALWSPLGGGADDPVSPVALMAANWVSQFGKRAPIPDELIVAADKALDAPLKPTVALGAFAAPDNADRINVDGKWVFDKDGDLEAADENTTVFDDEAMRAFAVYIPYVFNELPVGHSIRAGLPEVQKRIKKRLSTKELILPLESRYFWDEKGKRERKALIAGIGGKKLKGEANGSDAGSLIATWNDADDEGTVNLFFRPSKVRNDEEWDKLAKHLDQENYWRTPAVDLARMLLSDGFAAMAARVKKTPVPEGQYESNPLHSAPDLVKAVGAKFDVSEDASVLYLQTLALLRPTTKNVRLWNDWKPARYKKAAKELTSRELLLEAKRARAGRSFFLPGGWEALKSPHPPLESWKLPLYGLARDVNGNIQAPLSRYLPLRPLHEIFAVAWERVTSGDAPAYEEVK